MRADSPEAPAESAVPAGPVPAALTLPGDHDPAGLPVLFGPDPRGATEGRRAVEESLLQLELEFELAPLPLPIPAIAPPANSAAAPAPILLPAQADAPSPEPRVPVVRPPRRDDDDFAPALPPPRPARRGAPRYRLMAAMVVPAFAAAAAWQAMTPVGVCYPPDSGLMGAAAGTVAGRIVVAESGGDANAKNKRSSATGAGQFLNGTWLDMIRLHRPDLAGKAETEILALRHDADLSRQMVARMAEGNAALLSRRCLPVTPGTLYLAHFAGGAGALAVLTAPADADAADTMARADSTGKTTRAMIVTANPFLARFTVADLKVWADRKMEPRRAKRLSQM